MRVDKLSRAAERPEAAALITEQGRTITYGELEMRISAASLSLAAEGAGPGERVLLVGENTDDMIVAILGAIRAGAWAVPLNARMSAGEIDAILEHCRPRVAFFSPGSQEAVAHARRLGAGLRADGPLQGAWISHMAGDPEPNANDVAIMLYTSGSTGTPKGVMLTHANIGFVAEASVRQDILRPDDRIFHTLPLSHSFGLVSGLLCALRSGAALQLCTRFSADRLAHAILHDAVTVFQGVPAMFGRLVQWAERSGTDLQPNALRVCYIGGSQVDPTQKRKAEQLLGRVLHHGYGMTECAPTITRTFGHEAPRTLTAGWPIPGIELELRSPSGMPLEAGSTGEIYVRGPNVMKGYFRDDEQTRAVLDGRGWLRTGDLGTVSAAGDLTVVGRLKELIIHGGFNVYPAEVEIAISAYPGVAQCAVLGQALAGDEEIVAFVEPVPGAELHPVDLTAFLRGRLAPYKIPQRWMVLDRLPTSGTGKIMKSRLRSFLGEHA